jgi:hypothetical protein
MSYMEAGEQHGRWLIMESVHSGSDYVLCRCECGTEKRRQAYSIKRGLSGSCGCLKSELTAKRNGSHGLSAHPDYGIWLNMVRRCTNPKDAGWADYGGRGIRVCDRWLEDGGVANFIADMGPRPTPSHSLDRLNNDGDYEPANCAWTTKGEQSRNTRPKVRNIKYEVVLGDINRLRELVIDLGGDPGHPYRDAHANQCGPTA